MTPSNFKSAILLIASILTISFTGMANAAGKTYTEDEFLNKFSGKSKKVIVEALGQPVKKQLSVKPTNASTIIGKNTDSEKGKNPVKVEMWYYNNIVKYDKTHTYKETEITYLNDRAMNIAFFNKR